MIDKAKLYAEFQIDMWPEEKIQKFRETLLDWFSEEGRDLPFRHTKDPYKIWVSEIMLQQTQVKTVIPYWRRFLDAFPTIEDFAKASEADYLKLWEGLGYYSRVRNMHQAAQQIMENHSGKFPNNRKALEKLKGIGPYTSGAIASIAFDEAVPAIDGNAMRVYARLFEVDADIALAKNRKIFEAIGRDLIDPRQPGAYNQAIMDLGASYESAKHYQPEKSPIREFNASYKHGSYMNFPVKGKNKKPKSLTYLAVLVKDEQAEWLIQKRPQTGLLANMWTFPLISATNFGLSAERAFSQSSKISPLLSERDTKLLAQVLKEDYNVKADINPQAIGTVVHQFTHLKWTMHVFLAETTARSFLPEKAEWVKMSNFDDYVFPVPQQKLIALLKYVD